MSEHITQAFLEFGENIGFGPLQLPSDGKLTVTLNDEMRLGFELLQDQVMVVLEIKVLEFDCLDIMMRMQKELHPATCDYFVQMAAQGKEILLLTLKLENDQIAVHLLIEVFDTLLEYGQRYTQ